MVATPDTMQETLTAAAARHMGAPATVENLLRLTGGSSSESWSFDMECNDTRHELILRRAPRGKERSPIEKKTEARLLQLAAEKDVPVPKVLFVLDEEDDIGPGYVMERIAGETIPRKILRDEEYAEARPLMARQSGEIIARIHTIELDALSPLDRSPVEKLLENYRMMFDQFNSHSPVFEFALRWLGDHIPERSETSLVHGDFRNGNLVVGPEGIRAILDWELAHVGDPMEDLGWLCVNSWRFGNIDKPVGGFGDREDLFAGYEAVSGKPVDPDIVHYWEVFCTLKWGNICVFQALTYTSGAVRSVNRAAIGRRVSETEIDLLNLLT